MTNKKHINLALIMLPVFLITAYFTGGMMTVAKFDSIFGLTAGIPLVSIELIHTSVVSWFMPIMVTILGVFFISMFAIPIYYELSNKTMDTRVQRGMVAFSLMLMGSVLFGYLGQIVQMTSFFEQSSSIVRTSSLTATITLGYSVTVAWAAATVGLIAFSAIAATAYAKVKGTCNHCFKILTNGMLFWSATSVMLIFAGQMGIMYWVSQGAPTYALNAWPSYIILMVFITSFLVSWFGPLVVKLIKQHKPAMLEQGGHLAPIGKGNTVFKGIISLFTIMLGSYFFHSYVISVAFTLNGAYYAIMLAFALTTVAVILQGPMIYQKHFAKKQTPTNLDSCTTGTC